MVTECDRIQNPPQVKVFFVLSAFIFKQVYIMKKQIL